VQKCKKVKRGQATFYEKSSLSPFYRFFILTKALTKPLQNSLRLAVASFTNNFFQLFRQEDSCFEWNKEERLKPYIFEKIGSA
jgi:hypothetical protein